MSENQPARDSHQTVRLGDEEAVKDVLVRTVFGLWDIVNESTIYIEIRMSGRRLNIDSILLFLWLASWGWEWGVIGLILAFPMIASLKIVLEHLDSTRGWAVLMSEE